MSARLSHHTIIAMCLLHSLAFPACKKEGKEEQAAAGKQGPAPSGKVEFHQPILRALTQVGLKVSKFEQAAANPYSAQACQRGEVAGLDVLICRHSDEKAAQGARGALNGFIGNAVTGAVRTRGTIVLAVADRGKKDLQGKLINKLLKTFEAVLPR